MVDSTGLKVFGEGEWQGRKHGAGKRRTWRKLHLGADPDTHDAIMAKLTLEQVTDGEVFPDLMAQLDEQAVDRVYADGAYDQHRCYGAVLERGGTPVIPPRDNAVKWDETHPRTETVIAGQTDTGRQNWKRRAGYHRRSLAETAMYRYKQFIGSSLRACRFDTQRVEAYTAIAVLNRLNTLGMPQQFSF